MIVFPSSFRDPSGQVFTEGEEIIRSVNDSYYEEWQHVFDSGLLSELQDKNQLLFFTNIPTPVGAKGKIWLRVEKIPFISYPYEWSAAQIRDAALLTLDVHLAALEKGIVLKDASAYNVQFIGSKPIFIDILSFERYREGTAWSAYRQFCMHFMAPLIAIKYLGPWSGMLSKLRTDGIPLPQLAKILPWRARLNPGIFLHCFAHAKMEVKNLDAVRARKKLHTMKINIKDLRNFAISLRNLIVSLDSNKENTQWSKYYEDTNYTEAAFLAKKNIVKSIAEMAFNEKGFAIDMGGNTGEFSKLISPYFAYTITPDIDPSAVYTHYENLKHQRATTTLPLIIDFSNPSPFLGWACQERDSFPVRCRGASFISALAIIHHIILTEGITFNLFATFLSSLLLPGKILLLEFIPPEDTQVQRLVSARPDALKGYNIDELRSSFAKYFIEERNISIPESTRILLVLRKKIN